MAFNDRLNSTPPVLDDTDDMENLFFNQSVSSSTRFDEYVSRGLASVDDPLSLTAQPILRTKGEEENFSNSNSSPPPYEEVVASTDRSSSIAKYLRITVSDPQKILEGGNSLVPGTGSYVTYEVSTETNFPQYSSPKLTTRRRFRDFVTLGDRLSEKYRGYFIPARPDKSVIESQVMHSRDFVENRRILLEKYLQRLAAHPVISRSEELRTFLEVSGKLPLPSSIDSASRMLEGAAQLPRQLFGSDGSLGVPTPEEASQPAKKNRDLIRIFKELRQSVSNEWTGMAVGAGVVKGAPGEEDRAFTEKKEKVLGLEKQLVTATSKAEGLIRCQQDVGGILGELGLSFLKLSKFEEVNALSSTAKSQAASEAKKFGSASIMASRSWKDCTGYCTKHLGQLHEYLGAMSAIHSAMADRSQAQVTAQTLAAELEVKRDRLASLQEAARKVLGGDQARTRRIQELEKEIQGLQVAAETAASQFETIKERNAEEFELFESNRKRDFFSMVEGFVRSQVAMADSSHRVWSNMAEEWANSNKGRGITPIH